MFRLRLLLPILVCLQAVVHAGLTDERPLKIDPRTFVRAVSEIPRELEMGGARNTRRIGPTIALRQPDNNAVFTVDDRIAVHLEFLPAADGAVPVMTTLNVRVRKGWFGKNITDIVAPYVVGTAVRIPKVDFSGYTGDFKFKITVKDTKGRIGTVSFNITVET